jgi:pimeloyl-ACP methyl ester carboxylesterase
MSLRKLLLAAALACASLHAQNLPPAIVADPPQDKAHPAALDTFQLPSHGEKLNALVYVAAGAGPHPVVILLHGFPGNERNLDMAQAIRRSGWDVLFFDYRGSWGTPGTFSFAHAFEDTLAAVAYLREPANAARLHADLDKIVLVGHSMGGLMALYGGAHDTGVRAVGVFSAANMAGRWLPAVKAGKQDIAVAQYVPRLTQLGVYPLAGCTAESLARELVSHAAEWNFPDFAPQLASRPLLVITSDDGLAEDGDKLAARVRAVKGQG